MDTPMLIMTGYNVSNLINISNTLIITARRLLSVPRGGSIVIQRKLRHLAVANLTILLMVSIQYHSDFLIGNVLIVHTEPKGNKTGNDLKGKFQKVCGNLSNHVMCLFVVPHEIVDSQLNNGHQQGNSRSDPGVPTDGFGGGLIGITF